MQQRELTEGGRYITRLYLASLPMTIVSIMGSTVCSLIDSIMASRCMGELALEAMNESSPVFLIMCLIGCLIGNGSMCAASIELGRARKEEANRLFNSALWQCIAAAAVFILLGGLFSSQIAAALASPEAMSYARDYIVVLLPSSLAVMGLFIPNFFLLLEGKSTSAAVAMGLTAVLDVLLDYLMMFVLGWGMKGAALATVLASAAGMVLGLLLLLRGSRNFSLGRPSVRAADVMAFARYGSSTAVDYLIMAVMIIAVNRILIGIGAGLAVIFAIVTNIDNLISCVYDGTGVAAGPAIGLFGSGADAGAALICYALSMTCAAMNSGLSGYYTVTGHVALAYVIAICRRLLFVTGYLVLFQRLGMTLWLFYPAAELSTLVLTVVLTCVFHGRGDRLYLLDRETEAETRALSLTVQRSDQEAAAAARSIDEFCAAQGQRTEDIIPLSLAALELLGDGGKGADGAAGAQKALNGGDGGKPAGKQESDLRIVVEKKPEGVDAEQESAAADIGRQDLLGRVAAWIRAHAEGGKPDSRAVVRLRSWGAVYDPLSRTDGDSGHRITDLLIRHADNVQYQSSLGMNTLIIELGSELHGYHSTPETDAPHLEAEKGCILLFCLENGLTPEQAEAAAARAGDLLTQLSAHVSDRTFELYVLAGAGEAALAAFYRGTPYEVPARAETRRAGERSVLTATLAGNE